LAVETLALGVSAVISAISFVMEMLARPIVACFRSFRFLLSPPYRYRVKIELKDRGPLYWVGYFWWGPFTVAVAALTILVIAIWLAPKTEIEDFCTRTDAEHMAACKERTESALRRWSAFKRIEEELRGRN
jgi:hypothetical protein